MHVLTNFDLLTHQQWDGAEYLLGNVYMHWNDQFETILPHPWIWPWPVQALAYFSQLYWLKSTQFNYLTGILLNASSKPMHTFWLCPNSVHDPQPTPSNPLHRLFFYIERIIYSLFWKAINNKIRITLLNNTCIYWSTLNSTQQNSTKWRVIMIITTPPGSFKALLHGLGQCNLIWP